MQPSSVGTAYRQVRKDQETLRGALALGAATLGLFAVLLGMAWLDGLTNGLSPGVWVLIAALFAVLVSLEVLFVRDYRRLRVRTSRRGPRP